MKIKISTIIITSVCVVAIVAVTIGYMLKEGIINSDSLFAQNEANVSSNVEASKDGQDSTNPDDMPVNAYFKEGAECYLDYVNENYEHLPIYFKFNSLKISKKLKYVDLCDDWEETKDKKGTITNAYSYVYCNVTIMNTGKSSFVTTLNNIWLHIEKEGDTEARAYNSNELKSFEDKDYFEITFKPNVKHNYTIAYILSDKDIKKYKSQMLLFNTFTEPSMSVEASYPVIEKK